MKKKASSGKQGKKKVGEDVKEEHFSACLSNTELQGSLPCCICMEQVFYGGSEAGQSTLSWCQMDRPMAHC